jgi:glycine/D-amino acid oxidase-like deaminating enzyme/nitrite reductase/ring-hydroxylating ferredoxin subunit
MGSLPAVGPSIWTASSSATAYPSLPGDTTADAVVIGGGITGLTTALLLLRQGLNVVLLESDRIAASTTGHTTAKLSSLHGLTYASIAEVHGDDTARLYGLANEAAIETVVRLARDNDIECNIERMPAFTYAETEEMAGAIESEVATARRLGLPASLVNETDLPFPVKAAIRMDNQAMFHPRKYCIGLARAFTGAGGRLFERTPVLGIEPGPPHKVVAASGTVAARHVVQATQLPFYDPFGYFTVNVPHQSYGLAVLFDQPAPQGMYLSAEAPTHSIRPFRDGNWTYLILSGEGHKVAREPDTAQRYAALTEWAHRTFGTGEPSYAWSAHDYIPRDGLPYIGRLAPDTEGLWVATGFKKWGLTNGTVAALILSDLIAGRENPWTPAFDSLRLKPKSSAGKMLQRQADLAEQAQGPPITGEWPAEADELPAAGGRVIKSGGRKLAVYRDESGNFKTFSAVCTHMGCDVAFNTAERTWDCPCHGSRFDVNGRVIHGPAVHRLKPFRTIGPVEPEPEP